MSNQEQEQEQEQQSVEDKRNTILDKAVEDLKEESRAQKKDTERHGENRREIVRRTVIALADTMMDKFEILPFVIERFTNKEVLGDDAMSERNVYKALEHKQFEEYKRPRHTETETKVTIEPGSIVNQPEEQKPKTINCKQVLEEETLKVRQQHPDMPAWQVRQEVEKVDRVKGYNPNTLRKYWNSVCPLYPTGEEKEKLDKQTEDFKKAPKEDQAAIDMRKAIDDSNALQTLLGTLIDKLTGMSTEQRGAVESNMEKGKIYRQELADKSRPHLLRMVTQIPDGHIDIVLGVVQSVYFLMREFEQMLSDSAINRKKNKDMTGA